MSVWEKQYDFYSELKPDNHYNNISDCDFYLCLTVLSYKDDLLSYYPEINLSSLLDILDYSCKKDEDNHYLPELTRNAKKVKKLLRKHIKKVDPPFDELLKAIVHHCDFIIKLHDRIHHFICEEMFERMNQGDEVYVHIDNLDIINADSSEDDRYSLKFSNEVGEPVYYLHCSLVSREMLEYDRMMFEYMRKHPNEKEIIYKPYFSEFIIPVDKKGRVRGKDIGNLFADGIEDTWYTAKLSPNGPRNEFSYVQGDVLTFASPGKMIHNNLELKRITDPTEISNIENTYHSITTCNEDDINDLLSKYASDIKKANVYNVGHANFITLNDSNDKTKIIYDIGVPNNSLDKAENNYNEAFKTMQSITTKMVIISHWDSDHYLGAYSNKKNIFNVPWVVSECNKNGQIAAKRIANYLDCKKKLFMVKKATIRKKPNTPPPFAGYNSGTIDFQLYKGYGTAKPITNINCQGIAVRIEINSVATLMCGDVPYNCLSDSIINNNEYEYVVIPHHASNMSDKSYNALNSIKKIKYPIICVNGTEELGKSGVSVEKGSHCSNIGSKSNQILYFTDDDTHAKVNAYICDLTGNNPIDQK